MLLFLGYVTYLLKLAHITPEGSVAMSFTLLIPDEFMYG